ncbi:hypothetical protein ACLSYY_10975, partial [[Pasteurella] aerogenes]
DDGKWVDDNPDDNITVDPATGVVTIPEEAVGDNTTVTSTNTDAAGNVSDPDSATAKDVNPPSSPDVVANPDGSVTVTPANDPDVKTTTVTYTNENGDEQTVTLTKGDDGKWVDDNPNDNITVDPATGVVTIPADAVGDNTDVTATNTDTSGNEGPAGKDTAHTPDTTPPSAPTVEIVGGDDGKINPQDVDNDGKVTVKVTPPTDAEVGDKVTVTGPNGQTETKTLEDKDGDGKPDPVEVKITPAPEGKETEVTATVTDKANNESSESKDTATTDTKVPGDSDGDGVADDAGKPSVVIKDGDDGEIDPNDVDGDGNATAVITLPPNSGYSAGDILTVTVPDGNGGTTEKTIPVTEEM